MPDPPESSPDHPRVTRRTAIGIGAAAAGAAAAGAYGLARRGSPGGQAADIVLRAEAASVELGSRTARTWVYDGDLPGRTLTLQEGRRTRIRVDNALAEPTTVHWHGIALANDMDGVPGLTQDAIAPGDSFVYDFVAPDPGTYMYHSHVGVQLDRGLYGLLIVEPRSETIEYDRVAEIVLDDWLDGIDGTPDEKLADLRENGMDMGDGMEMGNGMDLGGMGSQAAMARHITATGGKGGPVPAGSLPALANALERGDADPGDVRHPLHLINGRPPEDPSALRVRRGERLRLRIANPGADTLYCVFAERHELTITHTDGQPVEPVTTDAVLVGMGERYDVLLEAGNPGAGRIIAIPLGKPGRAVATLRYVDAPESAMPAPGDRFRMPRRIATYAEMVPIEAGAPRSGAVETRLDLGMGMSGYRWTIGGQAFPKAEVVRYAEGAAVRLVMRNRTMMPHPMHLHGHFFQPVVGDRLGPRKDTILVAPKATTAVEFVADNPGRWAFHCHNAYHQEAGMMREVEVAPA